MNSLQDEFDNAGHSAQCTVAVHVHRIPYFIFNNPQNTPPIPFSRKLRGAKQNEKGMHVGQLFYEDAVLQYTVCLSLFPFPQPLSFFLLAFLPAFTSFISFLAPLLNYTNLGNFLEYSPTFYISRNRNLKIYNFIYCIYSRKFV